MANVSAKCSLRFWAFAARPVHPILNNSRISSIVDSPASGLRRGEYRIVYAIDEKAKIVKLARILHRDRDYRELDRI